MREGGDCASEIIVFRIRLTMESSEDRRGTGEKDRRLIFKSRYSWRTELKVRGGLRVLGLN